MEVMSIESSKGMGKRGGKKLRTPKRRTTISPLLTIKTRDEVFVLG